MKLMDKLRPYWCPNCPKRYMTEKKFHKHYMKCEYMRRLNITVHENKMLHKK